MTNRTKQNFDSLTPDSSPTEVATVLGPEERKALTAIATDGTTTLKGCVPILRLIDLIDIKGAVTQRGLDVLKVIAPDTARYPNAPDRKLFDPTLDEITLADGRTVRLTSIVKDGELVIDLVDDSRKIMSATLIAKKADDIYRRGKERVNGKALVGDIVGYADSANNWEPHRVELLPDSSPESRAVQYTLTNLVTGNVHWSELRQPGWTFAKGTT